MLLVIEDSFVDKIVKLYVPEEILNKRPILAGGFVAAIYTQYLKHINGSSNISDNIKSLSNVMIENILKSNFSDIDLFFLNNESKFILDFGYRASIASKNKDILSYINLKDFSISPADKNNAVEYAEKLLLTKVSEFAVTLRGYYFNHSPYDYQFIMRTTDSPEHLLNNFDINVCKIAYHDGKIYIHDEFLEGHNSKIISISKKFNDYGEYLWGYSRALKYKTRNNFNLDINLQKEMVLKYSEIYNFVNNDSNLKTGTQGQALQTVKKPRSIGFTTLQSYISSSSSTSLPIYMPVYTTSSGSATNIFIPFSNSIQPSFNYEDFMKKQVYLNCFSVYRDYIVSLIKTCDINTLYYIVDCNDIEMQKLLQERFDEDL